MNQSFALPQAYAKATERLEGDCAAAFSGEFDYVYRILRGLGVPHADVEDLAHDVLLVLHRAWRNYDRSRPLRPYLFGIAVRVASSNRRRYWRETSFAAVEAADWGPRQEDALCAKRARDIVLAGLAHIPLPRRAVLAMHDIDEISMRDIARELSIPLFTVYSRLRKARREFEKAVVRLQKEMPGP
jgi:RNA polymerase sigma-70 factor (ECF subfamily)